MPGITAYRDIVGSPQMLTPYASVNSVSFHIATPKLAFLQYEINITSLSVNAGTTYVVICGVPVLSFLTFTGNERIITNDLTYHINMNSGILTLAITSAYSTTVSVSIKDIEHMLIDSSLQAVIPNYSIMW